MTVRIFQAEPGVSLALLDSRAAAKMYLAQLPDGRQFQLSEPMYQLLGCMQEPISIQELAEAFECRTGKTITESTVMQVIEQVLAPRGFIAGMEVPSTADAYQRPRSLLALHYTQQLFSAGVLAPLTGAVSFLYRPVLVGVLLALTALIHIFTYTQLGLPPTVDISQLSMWLFLLLMLIGVFVHEIGHLTGCRYWECEHGGLGFGIYFFTPVFYADVSQTWKLSRWQRVVVDLGGIYFQLLFTVVIGAAFWLTGNLTFLWTIVFTDLFILINLNPLIKFDGYWVVADTLGVPNLHQRIGEILHYGTRWLRWRGNPHHTLRLSPFARLTTSTLVALVAYIIFTLDLWFIMLGLIIPVIVQIVISIPNGVTEAGRSLAEGIALGNIGLLVRAVQLLFVPTIVLLNVGLIFMQLVRTRLELMSRRSKNHGSA